MNVFYCGTRNLYPGLQWAIASLLEHNKNVHLYIFAEDDELPFDIPCEHTVINVSGQTYFDSNGKNYRSMFTFMPLLRVCLPEMLSVDKIICLDPDTVICESLEPLWALDMTGKYIAWCEEKKGSYKPFGAKYYNFGVSVLNLKEMRENNFTLVAVDMLNTQHFPYIDQDVMNLLTIPDKSIELDTRYNESFCCGYTVRPAIVHYAGVKDWMNNRTMYRHEYLDKYRGV